MCPDRHHLALGPDGVDDDGVAGGNDEGREEEYGKGHHCHVQLPLPRLRKVDPALHYSCM